MSTSWPASPTLPLIALAISARWQTQRERSWVALAADSSWSPGVISVWPCSARDYRGDGIVVEAWGTNTITDVCGAGATAAAVFALALAANYPAPEAMYLANVASGIVVLEHGAAVCTINALDAALVSASMPVASPDVRRR